MSDHADINRFLSWVKRCVQAKKVRIEPKAEEEAAAQGWDDTDILLFLDDLQTDDFLRRERARDPRFDWIWVFTPEIIEPEGLLWIRLSDAGGYVVVVISFHPQNINPEEVP